jgi:ribosomal protein S18 acetylase RimI-like enzyme
MLEIEFLERDLVHSEYDWANIQADGVRVGKARCLIDGDKFTIFSIIIFPEYEGNGYGKQFVEKSKEKYNTVIADKVRFKAIGFWERLNFEDNKDGNWIFRK